MRLKIGFWIWNMSWPIMAIDVFVPESAIEIESTARNGSIEVPLAKYSLAIKPSETLTGHIARQSWQIDGTSNAKGVLDAMISNYQRQGFSVAFECSTFSCGGFDFRYNIETTPPPDFKVNIQEFYYTDMRKDNETITLLASPLGETVFMQQTYIKSKNDGDIELVETDAPQTQTTDGSTRWIIDGAEFEMGSSTLKSISTEMMQKIADRLAEFPDEICYIVGHSDQSGALEVNKNLSRARANSVRQVLINDFNVKSGQLLADGVGFLAPIADNSTEEGRNKNRRVEAVFLVN